MADGARGRRAQRLAPALAIAVAFALLSPAVGALPTPGLFCEPAEASVGRLFPEAMETNDFVGFSEALCGLEALESMAPDRIEVIELGRSVGWDTPTGQHVDFPVLAVEVTDETSDIPREAKVQLVFQLSIHGNEKDGREGGLRAIEDLVRGIGMAAEHPDLVDMLRYELLIFTFPNPDGWVHEELEYRTSDASSLGNAPLNFVRTNGNGKDLNRNWPTVGWMSAQYTPFSEPEIVASYQYLRNFTNLRYATDIHGMLTPADGRYPVGPVDDALGGGPESDEPRSHYLLTMVAAGRMDALEWRRITGLSELIKERVNADPELAAWSALPATGAWGGEANEWGMAVDAIGYEDSGFTGDFFTQDSGLNVPDIDFEMSYNHILFDNYYPGAAQLVNKMAIASVRQIVRAMMEVGALDAQVSIETQGRRTAVLASPVVITNAANLSVDGWAEENALDDVVDTAHRVFQAAPVDYWTDLQPYVRSGDAPGILDLLRQGDVTPERLAMYDNVVVPGSAVRLLEGDAAAVWALRAWTERGGTLVVTDSALALLPQLGLVGEGDVDVALEYTGAVDIVARDHALVEGVRGLARQTYVAVPLGYTVESFASPNWFVKSSALDGDAVGLVANDPARVSLGEMPLGAGRVVFFGAVLPDPTDESYHPYGLDSYSATYTANQILRNALGWEEVFAATPLVVEELGAARDASTPAPAEPPTTGVPTPALGAVLLLLALAAGLRRRR